MQPTAVPLDQRAEDLDTPYDGHQVDGQDPAPADVRPRAIRPADAEAGVKFRLGGFVKQVPVVVDPGHLQVDAVQAAFQEQWPFDVYNAIWIRYPGFREEWARIGIYLQWLRRRLYLYREQARVGMKGPSGYCLPSFVTCMKYDV